MPIIVEMNSKYYNIVSLRPKFFIPSSTPVIMEAKLSSRRIMPAACLLTSLPAIPIAMPGKTHHMMNTAVIKLI